MYGTTTTSVKKRVLKNLRIFTVKVRVRPKSKLRPVFVFVGNKGDYERWMRRSTLACDICE